MVILLFELDKCATYQLNELKLREHTKKRETIKLVTTVLPIRDRGPPWEGFVVQREVTLMQELDELTTKG